MPPTVAIHAVPSIHVLSQHKSLDALLREQDLSLDEARIHLIDPIYFVLHQALSVAHELSKQTTSPGLRCDLLTTAEAFGTTESCVYHPRLPHPPRQRPPLPARGIVDRTHSEHVTAARLRERRDAQQRPAHQRSRIAESAAVLGGTAQAA